MPTPIEAVEALEAAITEAELDAIPEALTACAEALSRARAGTDRERRDLSHALYLTLGAAADDANIAGSELVLAWQDPAPGRAWAACAGRLDSASNYFARREATCADAARRLRACAEAIRNIRTH